MYCKRENIKKYVPIQNIQNLANFIAREKHSTKRRTGKENRLAEYQELLVSHVLTQLPTSK